MQRYSWFAAVLAAVLLFSGAGSIAALAAGAEVQAGPYVQIVDADSSRGTFTVSLETEEAAELLVAPPKGAAPARTYRLDAGPAPRTATVSVADFGYAVGIYGVQVFRLDPSGTRTLLGSLKVQLRPESSGYLSVLPMDRNETSFQVTLEDAELPLGAPVWFCCWGSRPGSEVQIFPAARQNRIYTATIPAAGRQAGIYQVAAYTGIPDTAQAFVQTGRFEISGVRGAHLLVSTLPTKPGHFRVSMTGDAAAGITAARAAAWSEEDQSDICWYDLRQDGLLWTAEGDIASHMHHTGIYQVHVWAELSSGAKALVAAASADISPVRYTWTEKHGRNCEIYMRNPGADTVRAAVWSEADGQDDIIWYDAEETEPGLWRAVCYLKRHKGSGLYHAHVYTGEVCTPAGFVVSDADMQEAAELRGLWVPSVMNLDFPTVRGAAAQQQEFREIVQNAGSWGFNALFVQVRPHADALYESAINPWSVVLTGAYDQHPGYDPLAFMVQAAHDAGIELHAWLNPYRVGSARAVAQLSRRSFAKQHPEWVLWHDGSAFLDPSRPEVRTHITATVQEIIDRYEVDGIHFDDYFYPYNYPLPEGESRDGALANTRRADVTQMVREVSQVVRSSPKQIAFGISPFGIWKNAGSDPAGSQTNSAESYYSNFCDTLAWVREGLVDYVAPQLYWDLDHKTASYRTLAAWWADAVRGTGVDLIIGQGIYKPEVAAEILDQLALNDTYGEIGGSIYYRYADVRDKPALAAVLTEWNRSRN